MTGRGEVIAFRTILIHASDQLDHRVVCAIIRRDLLRALLAEVAGLLTKRSQKEHNSGDR
jgi:uncharacterized protein YutE (UPF0331/DUF86 family)